ncbi:MAG: histidine kinase [Planctomycetaceae bacterium]|nr:histidine kinase [Planctomycetaceae bacterium]
MALPLRVLIVEDRPCDAELMIFELRQADFEPQWNRVETELDFVAQLNPSLDIILADFNLPQFDARQALSLLNKSSFDIPLIVVSGSIGEELAIQVVQEGATDYLLKDRLGRLGSAVQRALELKRLRSEKRRVEVALRSAENLFRNLVEHSLVGIHIIQEGKYAYVNPKLAEIFGYTPNELLTMDSWLLLVADSDRPLVADHVRRRIGNEVPNAHYEFRGLRKDGVVIDVEVLGSRTELNGKPAVIGSLIDITDRRRAEVKLNQTAERLGILLMTSQELGSARNLESMLDLLLSRLKEVIPVADFGTIYIFDSQTETLVPKASTGGVQEAVQQIRLQVGESLSGRVFQLGHSVITRTSEENDALSGPVRPETQQLFEKARAGRQIQSNLCVPLHSPTGENIGTIALGSARGPFNAEDLSLLEGIAAQAAIAIQETKLFDEVSAGRQRLQLLSQQLITTQETERRHLARELHDEIGQVLTAIKMHLRSTQRSEPGSVQSSLDESVSMIDRAIDQVRNLSLKLRPAQLDELGLVAALHWFVKHQAKIGGFQAHLTVHPVDIEVPPEMATACFRITQESLTNAVRHGHPHEIHVNLRHEDDILYLRIRDDGEGFDVDAARQLASRGKSLGMLGMQERAQLLGGTLDIRSTKGVGTTIQAKFPLAGS